VTTSAVAIRRSSGGARGWLARAVPIIDWLPAYRPSGLRGDVLAGLVVAALAIPQSMGYAAVAGVGVQVGLYTLPPALLAYAIFGSSRLLMVGPVSTVSLLSGSLVGQLAGGDQARAVSLTSALAVLAGVVLVIAGLCRVGWVAEFLSEPIVAGFITGLVVLVILGQAPVLLGVHSGNGGVIEQFIGITAAVGHEHPTTVWVAVLALLALFGGHRLVPRAPWSLIVLIVGIAASKLLDLGAYGVAMVGHVPAGFATPALPTVRASDLSALVPGALAVAMVGLAEGLAAARMYAGDHEDRVDTDQELIAHGAADLAAGVVGGMGAAGSLSKTAASERAGGRTQMVGIVAAVSVVAVLLFASEPMSALPSAVLAAIVVHAVWGLLKPAVFGQYWRIRRNDGIAALVALVGVLALGALLGLLVAVGQSLLGLVYRTTQVHIDEMGKLPEEKAAWGSLTHHPERHTVAGLLVLRLDSPLFWANAATVFDRLLAMILPRQDVRVVLLDLEATNQLDATTERRLESFLDTLRGHDKDLYLVRVFHQVRVVMKASGFFERLGEGRTWHSISAAVRAARAVVAVEEAFAAASQEWTGEDVTPVAGPHQGPQEGGDGGPAEAEGAEWIAPRALPSVLTAVPRQGGRRSGGTEPAAAEPFGDSPVAAAPVAAAPDAGVRAAAQSRATEPSAPARSAAGPTVTGHRSAAAGHHRGKGKKHPGTAGKKAKR
jgi:SulP family sulfate permease